MVILLITTSTTGLSPGATSTLVIASTTSIPSMTCPKTVCLWSSHGVPPFSMYA